MDRGAWRASVHGVAKSRTWLSGFTFTFHLCAIEKEMATHSSVLAWRIPGMGEAWWAAVYGVAQGRTRLKRLSSSSSRYTWRWSYLVRYVLSLSESHSYSGPRWWDGQREPIRGSAEPVAVLLPKSEMDTQPLESVTTGYLSKGSPRKSALEQPCSRNE